MCFTATKKPTADSQQLLAVPFTLGHPCSVQLAPKAAILLSHPANPCPITCGALPRPYPHLQTWVESNDLHLPPCTINTTSPFFSEAPALPAHLRSKKKDKLKGEPGNFLINALGNSQTSPCTQMKRVAHCHKDSLSPRLLGRGFAAD